jgi:hypothetical protein
VQVFGVQGVACRAVLHSCQPVLPQLDFLIGFPGRLDMAVSAPAQGSAQKKDDPRLRTRMSEMPHFGQVPVPQIIGMQLQPETVGL